MPRLPFTAFVRGVPAPKGSVSGFVNKKTGGVNITEKRGSPQKTWQAAVQFVLGEEWAGPPLDEAVAVTLAFGFQRPKSVTAKKRPHHTVKPDVDKLARGCLDAMTGIVFRDDSQVAVLMSSKSYDFKEPGVRIDVYALPAQPAEGK